MADEEDDPYAVSDDDDDAPKGPPPKIEIAGRELADITQLKAALIEKKDDANKDEKRMEEIEELKKVKGQELSDLKQNFEAGKVSNVEGAKAIVEEQKEERRKLTEIAKEQYSAFKDRFEHLDATLEQNLEDKLKRLERQQLEGVGKESLKSAKDRFENPVDESGSGSGAVQRELADYQRSELDKKRVLSTFIKPELTAEDAPKECAICKKIVYPVERVFANKQLYHNTCFKCCKCSKRLTPTNYNWHQGSLLCKVHMLEVFHPELAKSMDPENTIEDEHGGDEEEEEYAVVSKPKQLANVVKSGLKSADDLAQISSLKDKKGNWESSVNEAMRGTTEKKADIEIEAGKVRANLNKIVAGGAQEDEEEEGEDSASRDPNIIRENKKNRREELNFEQVGDIKKKWKMGGVETAEMREINAKEELEELKKGGINVRQRFQERQPGEGGESGAEKSYDREGLDTSMSAEARKSFLGGAAFEVAPVERSVKDDVKFTELSSFKERFEKGAGDAQPVERTAVDARSEQLGDIKAAFEKGGPDDIDNMTPEERAELKKREIEAEFLRYKLARRQQQLRDQQQGGDANGASGEGSIKGRFETGDAFKSNAEDKSQLDVEIKMAGKAREKFKQIDAEGLALPIRPNLNVKPEKHISKWDKDKNAPAPEPINRRALDASDDEPEDEDAYDVKNLMNKFKNIDKPSSNVPKIDRSLPDLQGVNVEAKNLKAMFEASPARDGETADEKRKRLEEEFNRYKAEKEAVRAEDADDSTGVAESAAAAQKEEIQVAAEHASKMTAKWEKIHAKEAKKAEKSKMPQKAAASSTRRIVTAPKCPICSKSVYLAEQFECFATLYHRSCFRCNVCFSTLSKDGRLFCETHYRRMFNDVSRSRYVFQATNQFVVSA